MPLAATRSWRVLPVSQLGPVTYSFCHVIERQSTQDTRDYDSFEVVAGNICVSRQRGGGDGGLRHIRRSVKWRALFEACRE